MYFQQAMSFALISHLGFAVAHTGMIDNDDHRDVGLIYTKPNFQGETKAIFEIKDKPECLPLHAYPSRAYINQLTRHSGQLIMSILICKTDVKCTFHTVSALSPRPAFNQNNNMPRVSTAMLVLTISLWLLAVAKWLMSSRTRAISSIIIPVVLLLIVAAPI
jgi:hypothetical protein